MKIKKESIPYVTDINVGGENYQLLFKYNQYDKRIYVDLYDAAGELIYPNEPLTFGVPLWFNKIVDEKGNFNKKFPQKYIISNTLDRKILKITYDNIDKIELIVED